MSLDMLRPGAAPKPPSEHDEQVMLFQWAATQVVPFPDLAWMYAIPNAGGAGKSAMIRGALMKAEGLQAGYPDIGLDVARGDWFGLRLELKRRTTEGKRGPRVWGSPSVVQVAWHKHLREEGLMVTICMGWEEGRTALLDYLKLPRRIARDRESIGRPPVVVRPKKLRAPRFM